MTFCGKFIFKLCEKEELKKEKADVKNQMKFVTFHGELEV